MTPEQNKAKKLLTFAQDPQLALLNELTEVTDNLKSLSEKPQRVSIEHFGNVKLVTIRGAKGDTGDKGETGPAGTSGKDGRDGKDGQSIVGPMGLPGPQGLQGEQGMAGKDGKDADEAGIIGKLEAKLSKLPIKKSLKLGIDDIKDLRKELDKIKSRASQNFAIAPLGSASGTRIDDENLIGTGTAFTLAQLPITGTLKLYRGGAKQSVANGDYTISGKNITLAVSKAAQEVLTADYEYHIT